MTPIYKRELQGYFHTPAGYVFLAMFLSLSGLIFYVENAAALSGDILLYLGEITFLWLLVSPVLSMRLLAEEKRQKTDQLLLTSPASPWQIIAGKYLAAATVLGLATVAGMVFPAVVAVFGRVYPGEFFAGYLGFLLQGLSFLALDLFLSGMTKSAASAAAAAFGANFAFWAMDLLSQSISSAPVRKVLDFFSLYGRYEPFLMGQVSFGSIVFYLAFIAFFLLLSALRLRDTRLFSRKALRAAFAVVPAAFLVLVTLGVDTLEDVNGWQVDLSFNSITTLSARTDSLLSSLEHPVDVYLITTTASEQDLQLTALLKRYEAHGDSIRFSTVNLTANPTFATLYPANAGDTLGANDVIVACADTDRYRIITTGSYVEWRFDEESGDYSASALSYERQLTGAITYVTEESVPRIYFLTGHQELTREDMPFFTELLTENGYEILDFSLARGIPDEPGVMMILSPLKDFADEELDELLMFEEAGGSFFVTCDYGDDLSGMVNFRAFLRERGIVPLDGLIVGDKTEAGTVYGMGDDLSVILYPAMAETEITSAMMAEGATTLLLPGCRGFAEPEAATSVLGTVGVLYSGEKSFLRNFMLDDSTDLARRDGDESGPFALAVMSERLLQELSHTFALGCSTMLTNDNLYAATYNYEFLLSVMSYLSPAQTVDVEIDGREAIRPPLDAGCRVPALILLILLPVCAAVPGFAVLLRRRRR